MKATLTFNLPEEQEEFDTANQAMDLRASACEFANYLRSELKYNETLSEEARATLAVVQERFLNEFDTLLD